MEFLLIVVIALFCVAWSAVLIMAGINQARIMNEWIAGAWKEKQND